MRLTKLGHACVRLERDGVVLVLDPGTAPFADAAAALQGADAVLVTHQHGDHFDADAIRAAHAANDRLQVVLPHDTAGDLADLGAAVRGVGPGEGIVVAGVPVRTVGGEHAVIHPDYPVPANVGYLIDGLYHPGDALAVPDAPVATLLVPMHAPWSKTGEIVDFVRAVGPERAHPVHDGLLNETGLALVDGWLDRAGGTAYSRLASGDSVDL